MKISVIIPVYNAARYLRECISSIAEVIEQCKSKSVDGRVADVEVICVDDCSTDGSYEILKELSATLPFALKLLHCSENQGVSAARNRGIEDATGDYIWFVDADDIIAPCALRNLANTISTNPADIITFAWRAFKDGDTVEWHEATEFSLYDMSNPAQAVNAFNSLGGSLWAYNGIYRKAALNGLRFKPYPNGEDMLFAYEMILRSRTIVSTNGVLYGYRDNAAGASRKHDERHLRSLMCVAKDLNQDILSSSLASVIEPYRFKHINGVMHTWGMIIADKLGKRGYDIWRETARKIYPIGWLRLLIALRMNFFLYLSTMGVVKVKVAILKIVRSR